MNKLVAVFVTMGGILAASGAAAQTGSPMQQMQSQGAQTPYIPYSPPSATMQTPPAQSTFAPTAAPPAPVFPQPNATLLQNGATPGVTAPTGAPGTVGGAPAGGAVAK